MIRQREPRKVEKDYMAWIRRQPCVGCAVSGRAQFGSEAAHFKAGIAAHGWREAGLSERGSDRRCLPLCAEHHRGNTGEHMNGQRAYWDSLGICPGCLAIALASAYDAGASGLDVIWTAVRARRTDGQPTC